MAVEQDVILICIDWRNRDAISRQLLPQDAVFLSGLFSETVAGIVNAAGGTECDAGAGSTVAVFGIGAAPRAACRSALSAAYGIDLALSFLADRWKNEFVVVPDFSLCVHAGLAAIGEVGSENSRRLIAAGTGVDAAQRLRAAAVGKGAHILVSVDVLQRAGAAPAALAERRDTGRCGPLAGGRAGFARSHQCVARGLKSTGKAQALTSPTPAAYVEPLPCKSLITHQRNRNEHLAHHGLAVASRHARYGGPGSVRSNARGGQGRLGAAKRNGDALAPGDAGMRLDELYPQRYPHASARVAVTRAQIKAELADAIRSGDMVASGEGGARLKEELPQRYPSVVVARSTKTRAQVNAETREAIRSGEVIARGEGTMNRREGLPQRYARSRASEADALRLSTSSSGRGYSPSSAANLSSGS